MLIEIHFFFSIENLFPFVRSFFTKMPSEHYMIEAKLILGTAPEDVPRSDEIRTIIKDIYDIRASKLRTSMDDFIKGEGTYAKLDYLTTLEIHSVRPLLPHSLDFIARLQKVSKLFCCVIVLNIPVKSEVMRKKSQLLTEHRLCYLTSVNLVHQTSVTAKTLIFKTII